MKNFVLSIFFVFFASFYLSVLGQNTPTPGAPAGAGTPAGAGDKNLSDELRKMNSIELERIKREAGKAGSTPPPAINSKIETKFPEIKEDFESIQISQAAIIKTYTTDKTIDYSLIEISAETINKNAKRLDTNLFAETIKKKEKETTDKSAVSEKEPNSMRVLIVELDNAIGSFVSSKIFGNLKVVEPDVAIKTRHDLLLIQELSAKLSAEAKKLK